MAIEDVGIQLKAVFSKLSLFQKVSIIAATAAVFLSIVVLIIWANKPAYRTLYANMNQEDAGLVIQNLKDKKIPYRLKDSGRSVEIPQNMVYEARIELAQEGVPRGGGSGFELFDKATFGMTEFVQNINYQRALQGELSRTITSLREISEARVHLTIPKERLFVTSDTETKAAIVLKLASGNALNRNTVKSIASLVSGSVKGLKLENVQIVDSSGRLLSEFLDEENMPFEMTNTQLEYQKKIEKMLEQKANTILNRTLGAANAYAQVSTVLDFDKRTYTKEEFDPNSVLRSSQTFEENSTEKPKTPSGVPGVESNLAEPNIGSNDTSSEYSKTDERTNFEIGKTVSSGEKAVGAIKRMTIAVVVNDKRVTKGSGDNVSVVSEPRSAQEIETIKALVASATGLDTNRGDVITVSNVSFDTSEQVQEMAFVAKEKNTQLILMAVKYLSGILIVILFYFMVVKPIMKRLEQVRESKEGRLTLGTGEPGDNYEMVVGDDMKFPKTLEELEKEIESELDESVPVDVESVKTKVMLKKIEEAAGEDPELLANLIKAWLREG